MMAVVINADICASARHPDRGRLLETQKLRKLLALGLTMGLVRGVFRPPPASPISTREAISVHPGKLFWISHVNWPVFQAQHCYTDNMAIQKVCDAHDATWRWRKRMSMSTSSKGLVWVPHIRFGTLADPQGRSEA